MDKIEIRLNNFLFNSGVVGLYKILKISQKDKLIKISGNVMEINVEAFQNFEQDYFNAMIKEYEEDTKWYSITSKKNEIECLKLDDKDELEKFLKYMKLIKSALDSASYKSGYEIIKNKDEENPYIYLENIKNTKNDEIKKEELIKIINYLKKYKEIFCMKDIIYTKINIFWENVAFLNRNNNKSDMKEEYKKSFILPLNKYLETKQKSEYNCIECGNKIAKGEAQSLSWIKDMGVDINRKKSGFWNFNEDAFICPICSLIYSCVPLGFNVIGSNGIFVNNNDEIEMLIEQNNSKNQVIELEKQTLSKTYQNIFYSMIRRNNQEGNKLSIENEPKNIQVIKRIAIDKDNPKYEFNILSKDKLEIFRKTNKYFENIIDKRAKLNSDPKAKSISVYEEVINNFLENKKQYNLINLIIYNNSSIDYIYNILKIQLNCIGGINLKDMEEKLEKIQEAGERLQKYFYSSKENENKLKSYILKLSNALRVNNVNLFMDILTRMYGSIGKNIPAANSFAEMIKNPEMFKLLGYSYILGLEQYVTESKVKIEGGNSNEE